MDQAQAKDLETAAKKTNSSIDTNELTDMDRKESTITQNFEEIKELNREIQ
jgi:hypothetical protein